MTETLGILWLRPWWLALVPIALLLGALVVRRARDLGAWTQAMDPELIAAMHRLGRVTGGAPRRAWLPALIVAALGLALAGPAIERRDTPGFRNLDAVVLVLDLSPSVTKGERLFETLTAARLLVNSAGTRQVGLVVYAGEAYVATPLTTDARAMDGTLALIDAETMPVRGSNPETGLALAERMLAEAEILAADVVLLTDGAAVGPGALSIGRRLAARRAPVSVLHLGETPELVALARTGTGMLAPVTNPFAVARRIGARSAERLAETDYLVLVLRDLGRSLLILALMGAVFLLPRRDMT